MLFPKSEARKRRLAVLRQMAVPEGAAPRDFPGAGNVEQQGQDFITACGARVPLRLSIKHERTGDCEDVLVERPWAVIGGDARCDIRLLHPDVSQRHTYLQFVDSRVMCCDLGSRTGTHGPNEIRARTWLKAEEPIFIGSTSIRFSGNDFFENGSAVQDGGPMPRADNGRPEAYLSFVNARNRTGRQKTRRIRRKVTLVGWSQLCNVRLQHSSVGRIHCSLVSTPTGLWLVDLLCRGGTRVNGEQVEFAHLNEGDEIVIGRFQMQVSYAPPAGLESEPASGGIARRTEPLVTGSAPDFPLTVRGPSAPQAGSVRLFEPGTGLTGFRPTPLALPADHSLSDHVAQSLMQQFSAIQQQLFDHTQQLLAAMAQTFNAAHTRQLDLIRDELFRVHEVNRELQELNDELTERRREQPDADDRPQARPGSRLSPAAATTDTDPEQPVPSRDRRPLAIPRSGAGRLTAGQPKPPISGPGRGKLRSAVPPAAVADEIPVEALLSERIGDLEQERSTRWEKILQILNPATSGGTE
jgi:pSer/pThr/pTyr-binding forkhead associated (FHA) protein